MYFLKEVVPQFFSAMIIVSAIIAVSQLMRLSEVLVTFGLTAENVLLPFLFILLPFMSIVIPISYLTAVLVGFSRLSADGEFFAMLASGYSLKKALVPVMLVGAILYGIGVITAVYLEPWGRREFVQFLYRKTQTELDNMLKFKMQPGVFMADFLGYVIYAEKISKDRTQYENVMLAPGADSQNKNFAVLAPDGNITGSVETGDLRLTLNHGVSFSSVPENERMSVLKFKTAEIDILHIFQKQILGDDSAEDDYRSYPPSELSAFIEKLKAKKNRDESTYLKARYLFHERFSKPFSVITFSLFAMVLGIADQRRAKGRAYIGAIATIILGYIFLMSFRWFAENNYMSAPLATWMPNIILLLLGGFLIYQKNRLPPSEGTLDWANMPFKKRTYKPLDDKTE